MDDLHRHELAVLRQDALDAGFFEKFCAVVSDVQNDVRSTFRLFCCLKGVLGGSVAAPLNRGGVLALAPRDDVHLLGHHESRVEAQSEVPDDGRFGFLALVLVEEFRCAREGNLVDVLVHLFLGHTNSSVANGQRFGCFIANDLDGGGSLHSGHFAQFGQCDSLLCCIDCVRYQFPQEDLVIAVQEFLDDWKNVFRLDIDVSSCHGFRFVCL